MTDCESHPVRKQIRLANFDYSRAGAYFVTVCLQERVCLFGEIVVDEMCVNNAGQLIHNVWNELPARFPCLVLDEFVVMPNHVHGILLIESTPIVGAPLVGARQRSGTRPAPTLGDIVGAFKSITTHGYIQGVKEHGWPAFSGKLWQRNYYEHVIRNERELNLVREYIVNNPLQWSLDRENPAAATRLNEQEYIEVFGKELP